MFEPYLMGQYQYPWQGMTPMPNWQPQTPQVAQGQQVIQGVRFVSGIEEAKNCTIPLGSKALLMDKEKDRFYLKETDVTGVSTVSEFEFKKVEAEARQEYIIRQEFEQMDDELDGAREYAQCALHLKDEDKELADVYVSLARTELDHYQKLYNQMTRVMTNYRSEHGDLSPELQEFYDWQRTKTLDCMAEVKVLVDSYK